RFFRVWRLGKLPHQAGHPAYFRSIHFFLDQPFQSLTIADYSSRIGECGDWDHDPRIFLIWLVEKHLRTAVWTRPLKHSLPEWVLPRILTCSTMRRNGS